MKTKHIEITFDFFVTLFIEGRIKPVLSLPHLIEWIEEENILQLEKYLYKDEECNLYRFTFDYTE